LRSPDAGALVAVSVLEKTKDTPAVQQQRPCRLRAAVCRAPDSHKRSTALGYRVRAHDFEEVGGCEWAPLGVVVPEDTELVEQRGTRRGDETPRQHATDL